MLVQLNPAWREELRDFCAATGAATKLRAPTEGTEVALRRSLALVLDDVAPPRRVRTASVLSQLEPMAGGAAPGTNPESKQKMFGAVWQRRDDNGWERYGAAQVCGRRRVVVCGHVSVCGGGVCP